MGAVFFPDESNTGRQALERALVAHDLEILGWRVVPTREEVLGEIALASIPVIRQVLVTSATVQDGGKFGRPVRAPSLPGA